jgi:hypothetical protein
MIKRLIAGAASLALTLGASLCRQPGTGAHRLIVR